MTCWASHVPTFRHREAWAIEETAPSLQAYLTELKNEEANVTVVKDSSMKLDSPDSEILVVASKMKAYIKTKGDMNTSGDVMDLLSDRLRRICDDAIRHARQEGRKTVMARDFVSEGEG